MRVNHLPDARRLSAALLLSLTTLAACGHSDPLHAAAESTDRVAVAIPAAAAAIQDRAADFRPEILPLPDTDGEYDPIAAYAAMAIPAENPLTAEKAALGRQLYFDTRISGDGKQSCYGCHVCEKGLTDGRPVAIGAFDKPLTRSAPTMWNVGYYAEWYWDGRAKTLEAQALAAWKGGNMGATDPQPIVDKLNATPGYAAQFQSVFGGPATADNVSQALASYMRTIVGGKTPWDRWKAGDASAVSDSAKRGEKVFEKAGCNVCHAGVLFTSQQFYNVGIGWDPAKNELKDIGRHKVTTIEKDKGAFKAPTLRDITDSAPYFHDGSVATLEMAVKLMAMGGLDNPWIDRANLKKVELTDAELADLMAFLGALDEPCDFPAPPLPPGA